MIRESVFLKDFQGSIAVIDAEIAGLLQQLEIQNRLKKKARGTKLLTTNCKVGQVVKVQQKNPVGTDGADFEVAQESFAGVLEFIFSSLQEKMKLSAAEYRSANPHELYESLTKILVLLRKDSTNVFKTQKQKQDVIEGLEVIIGIVLKKRLEFKECPLNKEDTSSIASINLKLYSSEFDVIGKLDKVVLVLGGSLVQRSFTPTRKVSGYLDPEASDFVDLAGEYEINAIDGFNEDELRSFLKGWKKCRDKPASPSLRAAVENVGKVVEEIDRRNENQQQVDKWLRPYKNLDAYSCTNSCTKLWVDLDDICLVVQQEVKKSLRAALRCVNGYASTSFLHQSRSKEKNAAKGAIATEVERLLVLDLSDLSDVKTQIKVSIALVKKKIGADSSGTKFKKMAAKVSVQLMRLVCLLDNFELAEGSFSEFEAAQAALREAPDLYEEVWDCGNRLQCELAESLTAAGQVEVVGPQAHRVAYTVEAVTIDLTGQTVGISKINEAWGTNFINGCIEVSDLEQTNFEVVQRGITFERPTFFVDKFFAAGRKDFTLDLSGCHLKNSLTLKTNENCEFLTIKLRNILVAGGKFELDISQLPGGTKVVLDLSDVSAENLSEDNFYVKMREGQKIEELLVPHFCASSYGSTVFGKITRVGQQKKTNLQRIDVNEIELLGDGDDFEGATIGNLMVKPGLNYAELSEYAGVSLDNAKIGKLHTKNAKFSDLRCVRAHIGSLQLDYCDFSDTSIIDGVIVDNFEIRHCTASSLQLSVSSTCSCFGSGTFEFEDVEKFGHFMACLGEVEFSGEVVIERMIISEKDDLIEAINVIRARNPDTKIVFKNCYFGDIKMTGKDEIHVKNIEVEEPEVGSCFNFSDMKLEKFKYSDKEGCASIVTEDIEVAEGTIFDVKLDELSSMTKTLVTGGKFKVDVDKGALIQTLVRSCEDCHIEASANSRLDCLHIAPEVEGSLQIEATTAPVLHVNSAQFTVEIKKAIVPGLQIEQAQSVTLDNVMLPHDDEHHRVVLKHSFDDVGGAVIEEGVTVDEDALFSKFEADLKGGLAPTIIIKDVELALRMFNRIYKNYKMGNKLLEKMLKGFIQCVYPKAEVWLENKDKWCEKGGFGDRLCGVMEAGCGGGEVKFVYNYTMPKGQFNMGFLTPAELVQLWRDRPGIKMYGSIKTEDSLFPYLFAALQQVQPITAETRGQQLSSVMARAQPLYVREKNTQALAVYIIVKAVRAFVTSTADDESTVDCFIESLNEDNLEIVASLVDEQSKTGALRKNIFNLLGGTKDNTVKINDALAELGVLARQQQKVNRLKRIADECNSEGWAIGKAHKASYRFIEADMLVDVYLPRKIEVEHRLKCLFAALDKLLSYSYGTDPLRRLTGGDKPGKIKQEQIIRIVLDAFKNLGFSCNKIAAQVERLNETSDFKTSAESIIVALQTLCAEKRKTFLPKIKGAYLENEYSNASELGFASVKLNLAMQCLGLQIVGRVEVEANDGSTFYTTLEDANAILNESSDVSDKDILHAWVDRYAPMFCGLFNDYKPSTARGPFAEKGRKKREELRQAVKNFLTSISVWGRDQVDGFKTAEQFRCALHQTIDCNNITIDQLQEKCGNLDEVLQRLDEKYGNTGHKFKQHLRTLAPQLKAAADTLVMFKQSVYEPINNSKIGREKKVKISRVKKDCTRAIFMSQIDRWEMLSGLEVPSEFSSSVVQSTFNGLRRTFLNKDDRTLSFCDTIAALKECGGGGREQAESSVSGLFENYAAKSGSKKGRDKKELSGFLQDLFACMCKVNPATAFTDFAQLLKLLLCAETNEETLLAFQGKIGTNYSGDSKSFFDKISKLRHNFDSEKKKLYSKGPFNLASRHGHGFVDILGDAVKILESFTTAPKFQLNMELVRDFEDGVKRRTKSALTGLLGSPEDVEHWSSKKVGKPEKHFQRFIESKGAGRVSAITGATVDAGMFRAGGGGVVIPREVYSPWKVYSPRRVSQGA